MIILLALSKGFSFQCSVLFATFLVRLLQLAGLTTVFWLVVFMYPGYTSLHCISFLWNEKKCVDSSSVEFNELGQQPGKEERFPIIYERCQEARNAEEYAYFHLLNSYPDMGVWRKLLVTYSITNGAVRIKHRSIFWTKTYFNGWAGSTCFVTFVLQIDQDPILRFLK